MTPSEVIELLGVALAAAKALEAAGASSADSVVELIDAHPLVVQARARIAAALTAKFPNG